MKGIIEKTIRGWVVKEIIGEGPETRLIQTYPLHPFNVENLEPCVLGEYGEVVFDVVKDYTDSNTNQVQEYAKLTTPMLDRLRRHLDSITPEQFNKEIDDIIKNDTSVQTLCEGCGMEECVCDKKYAIEFGEWLFCQDVYDKKSALEFGEWLLSQNISYLDNTSEGNTYKFQEFKLTMKEIYELYLKKI